MKPFISHSFVFVSSKEVFGSVSGHLTASVELILEEDVIYLLCLHHMRLTALR